MRLTIAAVGRLRTGAEADLVADYVNRASTAGRPHALGPVTVNEVDDRKARDRAAQGARLMDGLGAGTSNGSKVR